MPINYTISHPLLSEPGTSQGRRARALLESTVVKVDDKELVDRLYFIYRYSNQVSFRSYVNDATEGDFAVEDDWSQFFKYSTPFILAQIAYFDVESIKTRFKQAVLDYQRQPGDDHLQRLLELCFGEAFMPLFLWYEAFAEEEKLLQQLTDLQSEEAPGPLAFRQFLGKAIQSNLSKELLKFIEIYQHIRLNKPIRAFNFVPFVQQGVWGIAMQQLCCPELPVTENWVEDIQNVFDAVLKNIEEISAVAPNFVKESLIPLQQVYQKRHQPHLGLLFAFLELFEFVRTDLNKLSNEHLEFFFRKVLRIKPKKAKADHVHLVFEIAKHLQQFLLEKDTLFKDGKDGKNKDVFFKLDEELVLDKAQVKSLQTLFLHFKDGETLYKKNCADVAPNPTTDKYFGSYIHGVHAATVANSASGNGPAFEAPDFSNWPTLGNQHNKLKAPGKETPAVMPPARIGFVLASPVLLLQEGQREIKLKIRTQKGNNLGFVGLCDLQTALERAVTQKYFWLKPELFFKLDTLFAQEEEILTTAAEMLQFIYFKKKNFIQQIWIDCLLRHYEFPLNITDVLPSSNDDDATFEGKTLLDFKELYKKIIKRISDEGRAYLIGLLARQNPYPFGYDLEGCLDVKKEPSCEPLFTCCEKLLLYLLLDTAERENCVFPASLTSEGNNRCFPMAVMNYLETGIKKEVIDIHNQSFAGDDCLADCEDYCIQKNYAIIAPKAIPKNFECVEKFLQMNSACEPLFHISVSTEAGWYQPKRVKTEFQVHDDIQEFHFTITLDEQEPPVVFLDPEKLKEDYKLDKPFPAVKLELNEALKVRYPSEASFEMVDFDPAECPTIDEICWNCDDEKPGLKRRKLRPTDETNDPCCYKRDTRADVVQLSLYEIFRDLEIQNSRIDVTVCGVKKHIIVQNDENVQDVNAPMYPFGVRPNVPDSGIIHSQLEPGDTIAGQTQTQDEHCPDGDLDSYKNCNNKPELPEQNLVGPNFYIGSQEIFKKRWKNICIHLNWKDKPADFHHYYAAYKNVYDCDFEVNLSVLEQGAWKRETNGVNPYLKSGAKPNPKTLHYNRELFQHKGHACACACPDDLPPAYGTPFPFEQTIRVEQQYFALDRNDEKNICETFTRLYPYSRDGFLRLSLENQDFFHKDYAYILSRQLMALAKFPEYVPESMIVGTVPGGTPKKINLIEFFKDVCEAKALVDQIKLSNWWNSNQLGGLQTDLSNLKDGLDDLITFLSSPIGLITPGAVILNNTLPGGAPNINSVHAAVSGMLGNINGIFSGFFNNFNGLNFPGLGDGLFSDLEKLFFKLNELCQCVVANTSYEVLIPNEPWTPIIKNLALDYSACAGKSEIELVHLYPYHGTFKRENMESQPTMLPVYRDEGTLFIGLENLTPGGSINLLFQLAESTADSESDRANLIWHYLSNNQWLPLRDGFEIIDDATKGLTVSGVIQIALPNDISRLGNTVMPDHLFWLKATVAEPLYNTKKENVDFMQRGGRVRAICETLAVYAQAMRATYAPTPENDPARLTKALEPEKITKLNEPKAEVKKVEQPFASFGGRAEEIGSTYYKRVSEHLRHKGRAIDAFDYESMILEAFPTIYKVKCIQHDLGLSARDFHNDLELAPGFVLLAVIPDLDKLKSADGLSPKAPVSLLEEIKAFLRKRISPFVRLKVMNPRYEAINLNVEVKLYKGRNRDYYGAKLKEDLHHFFAPWDISNDTEKLVFGQSVRYSEVVRFIETLDYVDYIANLELFPETEPKPCCTKPGDSGEDKCPGLDKVYAEIKPLTARSILTAGEICVKVLEEDCKTPGPLKKGILAPFECTEVVEKANR